MKAVKTVAVAVAMIVAASTAQADSNLSNAEAALIGGLIVGTVIAFQNAQQPVYQQPQVIYQQRREMPVYTERYLPPACNAIYDQFGRWAGCMR